MNYAQILSFKTPYEIKQEALKLNKKYNHVSKTLLNLSKHRNRIGEQLKIIHLFCDHREEDGQSACTVEIEGYLYPACRFCGYRQFEETAI